jgi:hypothetical protein
MTDDDRALLRLAGYALAHAAWSVEDGETLCTLAMVERPGHDGRDNERDNERELLRFEAPTIPISVEMAHEQLERLPPGNRAVLVYDGYVTPEGGERSDGLIAMLQPGPNMRGLALLAYRAAKRPRFGIGKAKGFELVGQPYASDQFGGGEEGDAELIAGFREHPHGVRLLGG